MVVILESGLCGDLVVNVGAVGDRWLALGSHRNPGTIYFDKESPWERWSCCTSDWSVHGLCSSGEVVTCVRDDEV